MDFTEAKYIEPDFLERARRGGYVCPFCGNGSGSAGTGIKAHGQPPRYHCFVCGFSGDVIDLYGKAMGLDDPKEAIRQFRDRYGIKDGPAAGGSDGTHKSDSRDIDGKEGKAMNDMDARTEDVKDSPEDFLGYYRERMAENDGQYLATRGISKKTQDHFLIGYDPAWAVKDGVTPTPRLIIPRTRTAYYARDVRRHPDEQQKRYAKMNVGTAAIFNEMVLLGRKPGRAVFVVEGEIDAMSVYEAGGQAVAICGTGNAGPGSVFFKTLKEKDTPKNMLFFLMLDNDEPGRKAQVSILDTLTGLGYKASVVEYGAPDPNDLLVQDRKALEKIVREADDTAWDEAAPIPSVAKTTGFLDDIAKGASEPCIKTGIKTLDAADGGFFGGLHAGIYVLGAVSNAGKTTFGLQLAGSIAHQRIPVMFFSAEQSEREMIEKSVSRETFAIAGTKKIQRPSGLVAPMAKNFYEISDGWRYKGYAPEELELIKRARAAVEADGRYLFYIDKARMREMTGGDMRLSVEGIEKNVKRFIQATGRRPVVFIDYLQNIAPPDPKMTDKQIVDNAMYSLEVLSEECGIVIWIMAACNRENYVEPFNKSAYRDSSSIEYSGDVLLGFQERGLEYTDEDRQNATSRKHRIYDLQRENDERRTRHEPVDMELKCLKQRNGMPFFAEFRYYGAYNYFRDLADGDADFEKLPEDEPVPFGADGYEQAGFVV